MSEPIYDIQIERNVPVPMRDGTVLCADVYRPKAEGRYPVIVVLPVMPQSSHKLQVLH
jgi:hypothetical protein